MSRIVKLVRGLPGETTKVVPITNAKAKVYTDYELTPSQIQAITNEIKAILDEELGTVGENVDPNWFYNELIEQPYREGTQREVNNFNQIAKGMAIVTPLIIAALSVPAVLRSTEYIAGLEAVTIQNYGQIKSLSSSVADRVVRILNNGIQASTPRKEIVAEVTGHSEWDGLKLPGL